MYQSSISALQQDQEKPKKKILPTTKKTGLREEFKKTFLPHLIDIFELRQMVRNYKKEKASPSPVSFHTTALKCPKEVLEKLEQFQHDVEEAQRWCAGMIMQISEAIQEAKDALENLEPSSPTPQKYSLDTSSLPKKSSWFTRLFGKKKTP